MNVFFLKFLVVSFLFFWVATPQAVAHTLKSDGVVGAVMHVSPEDDPIAGEQSDFFFEFKDTSNTFSPENCDCLVSIEESGEEIFSKPLFSDNISPSLTHASVSFTFPRKGIYSIIVNGKPIRNGGYKDFRLVYDIRIDRESEKKQAKVDKDASSEVTKWIKTHSIHALPALVAVTFVGYLLYDRRKQQQAKKNEEKVKKDS